MRITILGKGMKMIKMGIIIRGGGEGGGCEINQNGASRHGAGSRGYKKKVITILETEMKMK